MKVLAIVATKRKSGIISKMTENILKGAKVSGNKTELVNLYDFKLEYCLGCWGCERKGKCVLKDDFNEIFEKVKDADLLILSAPTYWSNVPGIMKTFFDRHCGVAMLHGEGKVIFGKCLPIGFGPKKEMKGKKAIFVTACTTPAPFHILLDESRNTFKAMHHYTRKIKAKTIAKIVFTDSKFLNAKNKLKKYENKAYKIGISIGK